MCRRPGQKIQGMGLLLGLVCDRPAVEVRDALLEHDILTGTSSDPNVLTDTRAAGTAGAATLITSRRRLASIAPDDRIKEKN